MKAYNRTLFIFRRDLRLQDNRALNAALTSSRVVMPVFIFDPRQIEAHSYQSKSALQFMLESLQDLKRQLESRGGRLWIFQGLPVHVLEQLQHQFQFDAIYVNRDYTPFSRRRDVEISDFCLEKGIRFISLNDALLTEPEQMLKADGQPYQVFTPFHQRAVTLGVDAPEPLAVGQWWLGEGQDASHLLVDLAQTHSNALPGGRAAAEYQIERLENCREYAAQRDFPALNGVSRLSSFLKFGCCSVREAYTAVSATLGTEHPLLRQFYWRDFFTHIAYFYPRVFGHAFHSRYDAIEWRNDLDQFNAWTEGRTGFPIVDAGMRELNQSGLMHNRVRMITASFLVKDLHISWRWGERYFAQRLLDYDPCLNNGNWQWAASTGCDAQPYFRIFNPWLQQQKFDPDCHYIKTWLPELSAYSPKQIHQIGGLQAAGYPDPIVDHSQQTQEIKQVFQRLSNS